MTNYRPYWRMQFKDGLMTIQREDGEPMSETEYAMLRKVISDNHRTTRQRQAFIERGYALGDKLRNELHPFVEQLKAIREEQGVDREVIAACLGWGTSRITRYETGIDFAPKIDTIEPWAYILGYDLKLVKRVTLKRREDDTWTEE